jgi:DNA-binding transcriptional LysR family regulator
MERAAASVAPAADGTGTLRVIFSASTAQALLAPVLREYRDCYPQLAINVQLEDTPQAIRAVEEGRCDLALGIRDPLPATLAAVPLFEDELHFAVSPRHAWAEKKRIAPADLARENFIIYRRGSVTFQAIEAHFLQSGSRLGSTVEIPSFEVMKELIKLGLGVGLMAPWVMAEELEAGSLVSILLTRPAIIRRWGILHQKDRTLRPSEQTFIGLCRMAVPRLLHGVKRERAPG